VESSTRTILRSIIIGINQSHFVDRSPSGPSHSLEQKIYIYIHLGIDLFIGLYVLFLFYFLYLLIEWETYLHYWQFITYTCTVDGFPAPRSRWDCTPPARRLLVPDFSGANLHTYLLNLSCLIDKIGIVIELAGAIGA